jgi:hypothetical protein
MSWVDDRGIEVMRDESTKASMIIATPKIGPGLVTTYGRFGDAPLVVLLSASIVAFTWRERRSRLAGKVTTTTTDEKNKASASDETRAGS